MSDQTNSLFGAEKSVAIVKFTDWMEWASNSDGAKYHVVLPMIQRGSVWAPHKILDLWDTLLRGMPVGAFMASDTPPSAGNIKVQVTGTSESRTRLSNDVDLIDGQQRTLAMLAGWPEGLKNPLRPVMLWVDLADSPQGEYSFRLMATTKAQPFGYARASMGGQALTKLERSKLRNANMAFEDWSRKETHDVTELWQRDDFMPWDTKFALPLPKLFSAHRKGELLQFVRHEWGKRKTILEEKRNNAIDEKIKAHLDKKISDLGCAPTQVKLLEHALHTLLVSCEFPVIRVGSEHFKDAASESADDNRDPPLAILFKRVGTGGEALSNADYVYSVIKHRTPEVHDLIAKLLDDKHPKVRAIYTPTTLVMSAVRMAMLALPPDPNSKYKITDTSKLDKAVFSRMIRNRADFMEAFTESIGELGTFTKTLTAVLNAISYSIDDFPRGLPKHALALVPLPLLETLLAWYTLSKPSDDTLAQSRLAMVRFVLQGYLCVDDYVKASEEAIKTLRTTVASCFPDHEVMAMLLMKKIALALPSPQALEAVPGLTSSHKRSDDLPISGWDRFDPEKRTDEQRSNVELYKRWWNRRGGHVHPMLLWLQREYVFSKFEEKPALAGMEEETPFDFDHLLPSAQWHNWTGSNAGGRLIDFCVKGQQSWIGNSIGNLHVLESGKNRSLGDASVAEKLKDTSIVASALIVKNDPNWLVASGNSDKPAHWTLERAKAFQSAVDDRAFALYKNFYGDLQFGENSLSKS